MEPVVPPSRDPLRYLSATQRARIMESPCAYCGDFATAVDHVVPWSRGGRTTVENSAPVCKLCNEEKFDFTPEEWRAWRGERGKSWPPLSKMQIMQSMMLAEWTRAGVTDEDLNEYAKTGKWPLSVEQLAGLDSEHVCDPK